MSWPAWRRTPWRWLPGPWAADDLRRLYEAIGTDGDATLRYGQAREAALRECELRRQAVLESCNRAHSAAVTACTAADKATALTPSAKSNAGVKPKGTANQRMLEQIHRDPESYHWTLEVWADFLRCARSAVHGTEAWQTIMSVREEEKLKRSSRPERQRSDRRRGRPGTRRRKQDDE
jgi:hypothetical protein